MMAKTAFLCPGQGAYTLCNLIASRSLPNFSVRAEEVRSLVDIDVSTLIEKQDSEALQRNEVSALWVFLTSVVAAETLSSQGEYPSAVAGYSVGQWSALFLAGILSFEQTVRAIHTRALIMNRSRAARDGSMTAVIGLKREIVQQVLVDSAVQISNVNCVGQYTIAGSIDALTAAEAMLRTAGAHKLVRLPVSGAWHCPMLQDVSEEFTALLASIEFGSATIPIYDNVTGDLLADDAEVLRDCMSAHLTSAVLWEDSIRRLIERDHTRFVELGVGSILTRFGFFINRDVNWIPVEKLVAGDS